jgi:hypothetical protein
MDAATKQKPKGSQGDNKTLDLCTKAAAVAEKLGEKKKTELIGDERDALVVSSSKYNYKGDNLEISYTTLDFTSKVNEKGGASGIHVDAKGDVVIKYKGKTVFDAYAIWNSMATAVKTHVNYARWERELEEVYSSIPSTA